MKDRVVRLLLWAVLPAWLAYVVYGGLWDRVRSYVQPCAVGTPETLVACELALLERSGLWRPPTRSRRLPTRTRAKPAGRVDVTGGYVGGTHQAYRATVSSGN